MLVNCVAYQRGQQLSDIPVGEVRAHLERPDCFVWVALKDPQPGVVYRFRKAKWM